MFYLERFVQKRPTDVCKPVSCQGLGCTYARRYDYIVPHGDGDARGKQFDFAREGKMDAGAWQSSE